MVVVVGGLGNYRTWFRLTCSRIENLTLRRFAGVQRGREFSYLASGLMRLHQE